MFKFLKKAAASDKKGFVAPADGIMFAIDEVSDPMFAQKLLGDGVAFKYEGDSVTVCAPAGGTLSALFPTGHAFGVTTPDGVELLVHIGIDTVSANGEGFKALGKNQGDQVKAGDPIVEVDLKKLAEKFDMSTRTDHWYFSIKFKNPIRMSFVSLAVIWTCRGFYILICKPFYFVVLYFI